MLSHGLELWLVSFSSELAKLAYINEQVPLSFSWLNFRFSGVFKAENNISHSFRHFTLVNALLYYLPYLHFAMWHFFSAICTLSRPVDTVIQCVFLKFLSFHRFTTGLAFHVTVLAACLVGLVLTRKHFFSCSLTRHKSLCPGRVGP